MILLSSRSYSGIPIIRTSKGNRNWWFSDVDFYRVTTQGLASYEKNWQNRKIAIPRLYLTLIEHERNYLSVVPK